ncbi:hypothetical protein HAX54_009648 [Datura stramonium]|uniref:Uncharacterized protein n=1 Tax=Datura stramonium TaxID=4076 RepID=A0ABS8WZ68_DATST|nr:hypothetical protein [Datura stramonium]
MAIKGAWWTIVMPEKGFRKVVALGTSAVPSMSAADLERGASMFQKSTMVSEPCRACFMSGPRTRMEEGGGESRYPHITARVAWVSIADDLCGNLPRLRVRGAVPRAPCVRAYRAACGHGAWQLKEAVSVVGAARRVPFDVKQADPLNAELAKPQQIVPGRRKAGSQAWAPHELSVSNVRARARDTMLCLN